MLVELGLPECDVKDRGTERGSAQFPPSSCRAQGKGWFTPSVRQAEQSPSVTVVFLEGP